MQATFMHKAIFQPSLHSVLITVSLVCSSAVWAQTGTPPAGATQQQRAIGSDALVRAWLNNLRTAETTVETTSISYDPAGNVTHLRGLKIATTPRAPSADTQPVAKRQISIDSLDVTDPREEKAGLAAHVLTADGIRVEADGLVASLGSARLEDFVLPSIDLRNYDQKKPITGLSLVLGDLTRAAGRTVALDRIEFGVPSVWTSSIAHTEITGLSDGRFQKLKIEKFIGEREKSTDVREIASVTLDDFDLNAFARLFTPDTYLAGSLNRTWTILARNLEIGQTTLGDATGVVRFAGATVGPIRLQPFRRNLTDILDVSSSDPDYFAKHRDEGRQVVEALSDFFVVDAAEVRKLGVDDGTAAPGRKLAIERLSLSEVGPRSVGAADVSGLEVGDGNLHASLKEFAIARLQMKPAPTSGESSEPTAGMLPTLGSVRLLDLHVTRPDLELRLANLGLDMSDHVGIVPTHVHATAEGLTLPVSALSDPRARETFSGLGLDTVTFGAEFDYTWQDGVNEINVETIALSIEKLGRLSVSGTLTNVPKSVFEHPETSVAALQQTGLKRFKASYRDDTLIERSLAQIAVANKQPPEAIKKVLTTNLPAIMAPIPDGAIRNRMIFAVIGLINEAKTLELTSTVQDPVPLTTLLSALGSAPQTVPVLLKLDAVATRRQ